MREATDATYRFGNNIANLMNNWYRQLRPYEGRTVQISYGFFRPISDSAYTVADDTNFLADCFAGLDRRYEAIQSMLAECLSR